MESLSAPTGREFLLWRRLLLIVSLLTFLSLPTTAHQAVALTTATKGSDVLLLVENKHPEAGGILWYKGREIKANSFIIGIGIYIDVIKTGPKFSGRESIDKKGTLLMKNVTLKDAGYYTALVHQPFGAVEEKLGYLFVYEPVTFVNLRVSNSIFEESEDAIVLTCDSDAASILWFFNDLALQLTERIKLSNGSRSLTINPIKREDSGIYHCEGIDPFTSIKSWPFELRVKSD